MRCGLMGRVVRCLIAASARDIFVRPACSALAPGQSDDCGFDRYRSGVVGIAGCCKTQWMLKWVPNRDNEWGQWLDKLHRSCRHRPPSGLFCFFFCGRRVSRRWAGLDRRWKPPTRIQRMFRQRPPPDKDPDRNQARTSLTASELNPASAPQNCSVGRIETTPLR